LSRECPKNSGGGYGGGGGDGGWGNTNTNAGNDDGWGDAPMASADADADGWGAPATPAQAADHGSFQSSPAPVTPARGAFVHPDRLALQQHSAPVREPKGPPPDGHGWNAAPAPPAADDDGW
jgi:hypothetical protein